MEQRAASNVRVYCVVLATSYLHVATSMVIAWSSPILPKLNLDAGERSLVTSLYSLGAAPGPFILTLCLNTIGRKGTMYILWLSFVVSWGLLLISQNIYIIYIARIIGGIGVGGACAGVPVYVAEISSSETRGRTGSIIMMFFILGGLLVYVVGPNVDYYSLAIMGLVLTLIFGVVLYFVPESPYYYVNKRRMDKAMASLRTLRGNISNDTLEKELIEIERTIKENEGTSGGWLRSLRSGATLKSMLIGLYLMSVQQLTGGNAINGDMQTMFEGAHLTFPGYYVPIINIGSSVIFCFLPVIILNGKVSTKVVYIVSGIGISVFLGLLGMYFYLLDKNTGIEKYSYISVIFLLSYHFFLCIGLQPLTWPLVAEILSPSIKGLGTGICGFWSSLLGFLVIFLFEMVAVKFGYSISLFGVAGITLFSSLGVILFVPDTTGLSLREIQELLAK